MIDLFYSLFSCRHRHITFPQAPKSGPRAGQPYVVCFDCHRDIEYDLARMDTGAVIESPRPRRWNDGMEQAVEQ